MCLLVCAACRQANTLFTFTNEGNANRAPTQVGISILDRAAQALRDDRGHLALHLVARHEPRRPDRRLLVREADHLDREQGVGVLWTITTRLTLSAGPLSILDADGSAIVIHVNADTYCPGGEQANCAGGGRAACGRLARQ